MFGFWGRSQGVGAAPLRHRVTEALIWSPTPSHGMPGGRNGSFPRDAWRQEGQGTCQGLGAASQTSNEEQPILCGNTPNPGWRGTLTDMSPSLALRASAILQGQGRWERGLGVMSPSATSTTSNSVLLRRAVGTHPAALCSSRTQPQPPGGERKAKSCSFPGINIPRGLMVMGKSVWAWGI